MSEITTTNSSWLAEQLDGENLIEELLADKRSLNTRRAYEKDLNYFFRFLFKADPTPESVAQFLSLTRVLAIKAVLKYKASLLEAGLKEATVNRRLAAIKSLVAYARKLDKCSYTLEEIKGEKIVSYRDTAGITVEEFRQMLKVPDRRTVRGKRDYALLKLLWSNGLRRSETLVKIKDFDVKNGTLTILGKGRGTQAEKVNLPPDTVDALQKWLGSRGVVDPSDPLFIALDTASYGKCLTGDGIYKIVRAIAKKAGITKTFSPHRIRHSIISALLDETDGDVRRVQKFSRHKKIDTLLIYDDNRVNSQKELSDMASKLV